MSASPMSNAISDLETQVLAVLVSAETAREGATAILQALSPLFDDTSAAIAVRDRDGFTIHTIAEIGAPVTWPTTLSPQFVLGIQGGVDATTGVGVIPLRAQGVVAGALLVAEPAR